VDEQTLKPTTPSPMTNDVQNAETHEEVLVSTPRMELRPAQYVEQKLVHLLRSSALMVSRMQSGRRLGR
jgi:hypothetical protein